MKCIRWNPILTYFKKLKEQYPYAVINVIITTIGGEYALQKQQRFEQEVLTHKPDVLFIDYALNDIGYSDLELTYYWLLA